MSSPWSEILVTIIIYQVLLIEKSELYELANPSGLLRVELTLLP